MCFLLGQRYETPFIDLRSSGIRPELNGEASSPHQHLMVACPILCPQNRSIPTARDIPVGPRSAHVDQTFPSSKGNRQIRERERGTNNIRRSLAQCSLTTAECWRLGKSCAANITVFPGLTGCVRDRIVLRSINRPCICS